MTLTREQIKEVMTVDVMEQIQKKIKGVKVDFGARDLFQVIEKTYKVSGAVAKMSRTLKPISITHSKWHTRETIVIEFQTTGLTLISGDVQDRVMNKIASSTARITILKKERLVAFETLTTLSNKNNKPVLTKAEADMLNKKREQKMWESYSKVHNESRSLKYAEKRVRELKEKIQLNEAILKRFEVLLMETNDKKAKEKIKENADKLIRNINLYNKKLITFNEKLKSK